MLPQDQRIFMGAYILGDLYRRAGQLPQAEKAIVSGLSQEPSEPFLHAMLGLTYKDMGRNDAAREHLLRAVEIWNGADPDFKPAGDPRLALADLQATP